MGATKSLIPVTWTKMSSKEEIAVVNVNLSFQAKHVSELVEIFAFVSFIPKHKLASASNFILALPNDEPSVNMLWI